MSAKICSHAHPELSGEFHLFNLETRAGKPRAEALRNLAARTGVEDVRGLVGTLIQTDRFGTSVAQALRVHSDSLRTERRQRAEEQAAKTTVKMIIPLVLFVHALPDFRHRRPGRNSVDASVRPIDRRQTVSQSG